MINGNFRAYEVTVANSAAGALDLSSLSVGEMLVKINPGTTKVHLLITAASSSTAADVQDYLLENGTNEFELGRGLDRLSFFNDSGSEAKISVAVLF